LIRKIVPAVTTERAAMAATIWLKTLQVVR
jgi:hypothetical protein